MRIAYFIDTLPPHYDGVVHTFCHLVETLEKEGIDFKIYSCFKPGSQYTWSHRVHKVFYLSFVLYRDYRMALPYFSRLYPNLDDFNPDLIHIIGPTPLGHYGLKYALKRKIKVVSSYHTDYISYMPYFKFPKFAIKYGLYLQRKFYGSFDRVFVSSKSARAHMEDLGVKKEKIERWNRGIDLVQFSPHHRRTGLRKSINGDDKVLLLVVGRLVKYKDLDKIVEMDRLLIQKKLPYRWVFAGKGPMRKTLESKLPEAHFTGFISGDELSQWYASSDILVFPSTTETFGNVILEAFASGIPAIVSNQGGVTENIQEGKNGFIAQANSAEDFANRIEALIRTPDRLKEIERNARKTIETRTWHQVNLELLQSYQGVVDAP